MAIVGCAGSNAVPSHAQKAARFPLTRHYAAGETVQYVMTGVNRGRQSRIDYVAECAGRVVQGGGPVFEEIQWTRLVLNGQEIPLDQSSRDFRQRLSLDAKYEMPVPDIRGVNPMLIGPVFDLMTFYVDLHPNLHKHRLMSKGDHVHVPHGKPNSWADGTRVLVGEDCIDFDLTLTDLSADAATLRVRHLPPRDAKLPFPAEWMHQRVGDEPNNWVQVETDPGASPPAYLAAVGREEFDVRIEIERPSGRLVSATMDNPVQVVQRRCQDRSLRECGAPEKFSIHRRIELRRRP